MRRRRASAKLERHAGLRDAVMDRLRDGGSPEPIAGRRRVEPAARQRLCHETIHRFVRSRKGRSEELARPLPSRRRRRRPRRSSKPGSPVFRDHAAARRRPAAVTDRAAFGRRSGGPRDRAPRARGRERGRERGHGRGADDPLHRALPKPRPPLEARHGPPHRRARALARHGAAQPPPRARARVRLRARARSRPRRPRRVLRPPGAPAEGHHRDHPWAASTSSAEGHRRAGDPGARPRGPPAPPPRNPAQVPRMAHPGRGLPRPPHEGAFARPMPRPRSPLALRSEPTPSVARGVLRLGSRSRGAGAGAARLGRRRSRSPGAPARA